MQKIEIDNFTFINDDNMNLSFVGIELDEEYFAASMKRFKLAHKQQTLNF